MSEVLQGAKIRYTELEKLTYALLMALRKPMHYFLVHASGKIGKWATELAPFNLAFAAHMTIKLQALGDFVAEWTPQFEESPLP